MANRDISFGTRSEFAHYQVINEDCVEIGENKFVIVFHRLSDDDVYAVVATVSGTTITWGSVQVIGSGITAADNVVAKVDADKFVVLYSYGSPAYTYGKVCTVSGTTITPGTGFTASDGNGASNISACYLSAGKFAVSYGGGGSDLDKVRVATVSGTTPTFGTAVQFTTSSHVGGRSDIANIGTDKFALFYDDTTDTKGYAKVGTVSGTAITLGAQATVENGGSSVLLSVIGIGTDKFTCAWKLTADNLLKLATCTVSGTTITVGAITTRTGVTVATISLSSTGNDKFICSYEQSNDTNKGKSVAATVSGTTMSFGTVFTFEGTDNIIRVGSFWIPNGDKIIIGFSDGVSNYGWGIIGDITFFPVPTVTVQAATSVTEKSATGNGNITNTGGENNDKRGFVYDTSTHTDPGNIAPTSSGYANYVEDSGGSYGTGAYTKSLASLSSGIKYYIRAYSHNSTGYAYSSETTFITEGVIVIAGKVTLERIAFKPLAGLILTVGLGPSTLAGKIILEKTNVLKTLAGKIILQRVGFSTLAGKSTLERIDYSHTLAGIINTRYIWTEVIFDGFYINNAVQVVETALHDSSPNRDLSIYKVARRDGEKIVSSYFARKEITITGFIQANSRAALEVLIDDFKNKFQTKQGDLTIEYGNNYRKYVATFSELTIQRDSDNIDWCPYTVKFIVPSGKGTDLTPLTYIDLAYTFSSLPPKVIYVNNTLSYSGTAEGLPQIKVTVNSATGITDMALTGFGVYPNNSTVTITKNLIGGDLVIFDLETWQVTVNGVITDYTGYFKTFDTTAVGILIECTGSAMNADVEISYYNQYL